MTWLKNVLDISVDKLYEDWDYHKWCIEAGWMDGPIAYTNNWVSDNFKSGTEIADVACGNGQLGIGFSNRTANSLGYGNNEFVIDGSSYKGKAPLDYIIGTWWNHNIVEANAQISAVSGRIIRQNVTFIGNETIKLNDMVMLDQYHINN